MTTPRKRTRSRGRSNQALQHFQTTPLSVLEDEIRSGEQTSDLRTVFGPELASEMQQMVATPPRAGVLGGEKPLVMIVPGTMGSTMTNTRGDTGLIWINPLALAQGKLHLLKLDAAGDADADPTALVAASGLMPTTYLPMQLHLRFWGGCDVLSFPYDWRRAPEVEAEALHQFIARQRAANDRQIHLVCHSLGGLVARAYCLAHANEAKAAVAQIVMLGTPNYGSCEAVRNITVGGDIVRLAQTLNAANDPVGVARSAPALYAMLPAPTAHFPANAPYPWPFFAGFDYLDAAVYATADISAHHLAAARTAYEHLPNEPLPVPVTTIIGHDVTTCVGVVKNAGGAFDFDAHVTQDGDGTVPMASAAALPGAHNLFVRGGKHGDLPLYNNVRNAVQALVQGQQPALPTVPSMGVLAAEDEQASPGVPEAPLPGTLTQKRLDTIAARIRAGTATPKDLAALTKLR